MRCAGTHKGPDGVRLATRSMLLLAAYCQETGAHAEANYALMRAHFQASCSGAGNTLTSCDGAQRCPLFLLQVSAAGLFGPLCCKGNMQLHGTTPGASCLWP